MSSSSVTGALLKAGSPGFASDGDRRPGSILAGSETTLLNSRFVFDGDFTVVEEDHMALRCIVDGCVASRAHKCGVSGWVCRLQNRPMSVHY